VLGGMLGRLADEPRERDQRERCEHELDRLGEVCGVVEDDDERRERQRPEENPPDHRARTLDGRSVRHSCIDAEHRSTTRRSHPISQFVAPA
jgi:hypothetical protein